MTEKDDKQRTQGCGFGGQSEKKDDKRNIMLTDGPHGLRKQGGAADHLGLNASIPATCFPTAAALADSWDESLAESVGVCLGLEAAANDVTPFARVAQNR